MMEKTFFIKISLIIKLYAMKKMLFLILTTFALSSCDKTKTSLDEVFEVQQGKPVTITNIKVSLDSVEDSRCPNGAVCIQAGWAIAKLTFTKGSEQTSQSLKVLGLSNPPKPDTVSVFGKKVILYDVAPYPTVNVPIAQKDYRVKMKLE
jgi:hypothetical protein